MKFFAVLLILACSCGRGENPSKVKEAINEINDPRLLMPLDWIIRVSDLPKEASIGTPIWTGNWWPMSQGGTSNAMAKYDRATGTKGAGAWEWQEAQSMKDTDWAGHCNGLAAAGMMVPEPRHSVTYNGVRFDIEDVKALLSEAWASGYVSVGGRCDGVIERDMNGRAINPYCRDTNPATLHLALTNLIGLKHTPLVSDTEAGETVWNYIITRYKILNEMDISQYTAAIWLAKGASAYPFNPAASAWKFYTMEVEMATVGIRYYQYVLELDWAGNIIGGEWYGDSRLDHPDFLWRPTVESAVNPYLDLKVVNAIHQASVGGR